MSQKDNILQELRELQSKLPANTQIPYAVPSGYFEGLAELMLKRVKALEAVDVQSEIEHLSPFLAKLSKKMPFSIPSNYFEELDPVFATISDDKELEVISPMLSGIGKQMPFTVPQGYFDTIPGNTDKKETAKIVSFSRTKWMRYAAAAVVTGLLVMFGFLIRKDNSSGDTKAIAKLTRDVKKMDEMQKEKLLNLIDAGMTGNETAHVSVANKSTIKGLLQDVSDEELNNFEQQTEDVEDVLMTE